MNTHDDRDGPSDDDCAALAVLTDVLAGPEPDPDRAARAHQLARDTMNLPPDPDPDQHAGADRSGHAGSGERPRRLRLVGPAQRDHHHDPPRRSSTGDQPDGGRDGDKDHGDELDAAQAAIMLGVTEDEVLIRQRHGHPPGRLSISALQADCLDEFRAPG